MHITKSTKSFLCLMLLALTGSLVNHAMEKPEETGSESEVEATGETNKLNEELIVALYGENIELVRNLLDRGANPNHIDILHDTPLIIAVNMRNPELIKFLLERGADPKIKDGEGKSPVILAIDLIDFTYDELYVLESLLDHSDKSAFAGRGPQGQTPLQYVLGTDRMQKLLDLGVNIDDQDEKGWTALHQAAADDSRSDVEFLLAHGADTTVTDAGGQTADQVAKSSTIADTIIKHRLSFTQRAKRALSYLPGFWG